MMNVLAKIRSLPPGLQLAYVPVALIFLGLALGLVVSCASVDSTAAAHAPSPSWPPPPDTPYVTYLSSISQPADVAIKASAFKRFVNWVTGMGVGEGRLLNPVGVTSDASGNVCFTDTGANVVCCYNEAAKKWGRWDRAGKIHFAAPVAVAKKGEVLYVADSGLDQVLVFDTAGKGLFSINHDLGKPSGLAILGDRLFVTDVARHCVTVFDLSGHYIFRFGQRGIKPGEFNYPTHISADASNRLWVTDAMNGRVQGFTAEGKWLATIGSAGDTSGHFGRPKGVAVDALGHVYVADALFNNIQVFDQVGKLLLVIGQSGARPGEFALPNGIAIGADNRIYVADSLNHRIQVLRYVGPS